MAFEWDAPEDAETGSGNWLKEPGTYHFIVTGVEEEPKDSNKNPLGGFRVNCQALAGTTKDQESRTFDIMFFNAKLTEKNEGLFKRKQQARFFIATNILKDVHGQKGLKIDLQQATAQQAICTLEKGMKDGKETGYLQLAFANIWHVDDPDAASFPKCEKSLKLIPASGRRKPESFKKKNGDEDSGTAGSGAKPSPTSPVDLSSI